MGLTIGKIVALVGFLFASLTDLRRREIPNNSVILVAASGIFWGKGAWWSPLVLSLLLGGLKIAYRRLRGKEGIGWGDVKLLAVAALWIPQASLGWWICAVGVSSLASAFVLTRTRADLSFPMAPAISFASFVWILFS